MSLFSDAESLASGAYGGVAELGKIEAIVLAAMSSVVGSFMIIIGIDNIKNPTKDPNDPNKPPPTGVSFLVISAGVAIISLSLLWVWLTRNYKVAAAYGGATTLYDMFK